MPTVMVLDVPTLFAVTLFITVVGGLLLLLTFLVSQLTFGTGRTNILFGLLHLVVFAVYVFLVFVP